MSTDLNQPLEAPVVSFSAENVAVGWRSVVFCGTVAALFIYFDNLPIYHSDVWGHVSYGEWILDNGRLPSEEPFLDLAEGVPVVDSAWLSQVTLAAANRVLGPAWVGHAFGLTMTVVVVLFALGLWVRTSSPIPGLLGALTILALAPTRIAVVRPETFGTLCFALLLLLVTVANARFDDGVEGTRVDPRRWALGAAAALVMGLWANLHGSYVVGIAVLATLTVGRFLEIGFDSATSASRAGRPSWWRSGLVAAIRDPRFRYWLVVTEAATAATLLNPHGVDLLLNTLTFSSNPNLADVLEWKPLALQSVEGITFSTSWIGLLLLARFSRVRFRLHEILLLGLLNVSVVQGVRMINWYAAVYVFVMAPHAVDVWKQLVVWRHETFPTSSPKDGGQGGNVWLPEAVLRPSLVHTAVCGLLLWWGFAFSPMGNVLLGGEARPAERLYHEWTPIEAADWLREHPPEGRVFNPQWWGDWLVRNGPADTRYFMTTNAVHVVPPTVWRDYMRVCLSPTGWEEVLDRYGVTTVVVHDELQPQLSSRLERDENWVLVHRGELESIFERTWSAGDVE